jgi:hypothetical protein
MNSPAGLAQSEQFQTGSSGQTHLYLQHFGQFLIFAPHNSNGTIDFGWQQRLATQVKTSLEAVAAARDKLNEGAKQLEAILEQS